MRWRWAAAKALVIILVASRTMAANPCFWIHGRLSAWNGAPTFRIWRIGTSRILGVKGDLLPPALRTRLPADSFKANLIGDFRVCPISHDRPGRMRMITIADARHLVAEPR